jgi:hypothetical protein
VKKIEVPGPPVYQGPLFVFIQSSNNPIMFANQSQLLANMPPLIIPPFEDVDPLVEPLVDPLVGPLEDVPWSGDNGMLVNILTDMYSVVDSTPLESREAVHKILSELVWDATEPFTYPPLSEQHGRINHAFEQVRVLTCQLPERETIHLRLDIFHTTFYNYMDWAMADPDPVGLLAYVKQLLGF